ncbi:hypothetical protein Aduo_019802 [Ancylostoma duodenale]
MSFQQVFEVDINARKELVEPECAESARMRMRARLKCLVGWTIKEFRRHSFFHRHRLRQDRTSCLIERKKATCEDNKRVCANVNEHKG